MNLSDHEIKQLGQALSYAVVNAKTEQETAEFAMLKVKVESEITRRKLKKEQLDAHSFLGCPFKYCDQEVKCVGKCKYS